MLLYVCFLLDCYATCMHAALNCNMSVTVVVASMIKTVVSALYFSL